MAMSLWTVAAYAQSNTFYRVFIKNGSTVVSFTDISLGSFVCNQDINPGWSTTNPNKIAFDDPTNSGKVCIYTDPGNGPLSALPFGATVYTATIADGNPVGVGPESAPSAPFTKPGSVPTSVRTGLRIVR